MFEGSQESPVLSYNILLNGSLLLDVGIIMIMHFSNIPKDDSWQGIPEAWEVSAMETSKEVSEETSHPP